MFIKEIFYILLLKYIHIIILKVSYSDIWIFLPLKS